MVIYRLAEESDYESINAFHNRIYKSDRTAQQFLWEFAKGPFGKAIYVIAEDEGAIVGTNCVIPIDLIDADGQIIKSGKSEDTLVDPAYRGQKIFYHIYEFLFEKCRTAGIQVIWGFTAAKKPFRKLGFEVPYDHQQALVVNDVRRSYRYLASLNPENKPVDKVKVLGLCLISKAKAIGNIPSKTLPFSVKKEERIVAGVNELVAKNQSASGSLFAIHQTKAFQDWRIYQNPNYHQVHTYSVRKEDNLLALIVFNAHANGVAYVCQTTFHPTLSRSEKVQILQSATNMLFKENVALVRNWLFDTNEANTEEAAVHQESGYTLLKRGIGLVWKVLKPLDKDPQDFYLSRIATQGTI